MSDQDTAEIEGGCHCGKVRFKLIAPLPLPLIVCNCSMCQRTGYMHLILGPECYEILSGEECLSHYRFNTGIADHSFCKICGVKPFYKPRSHPDKLSFNANCLDDILDLPTSVRGFNGQDWEASIDDII